MGQDIANMRESDPGHPEYDREYGTKTSRRAHELAVENRQLRAAVQALSTANAEWAQAVNITGLRELQTFVNRWQRATFPKATAMSTFIHMCREVNELRAEINKFALLTGPGQRGTGVKTEIGDVGILLMAVCDMVGVDLASAITDKMAENLEREWGEPDAQGVVEHKR